MSSVTTPITLTGQIAALEPLTHDHHDDLCEATRDGALWTLWYTIVPSPEQMRAEIDRRNALLAQGTMLPWAVRDLASGKVVGMTTYMNIDAANRRLEIGSTWYRRSVQRTALNTEAKRLLLAHALKA